MKAMIAERAIRTIKERIEKYLKSNKTRNWIDIVDQIVSNYNETPHKTTGYAPLDVNEDNRLEIYKRMYPNKKLRIDCRLKKGDKVRKIIIKNIFGKGYKQKWSTEIYIIKEVHQSNTVCWYKIENLTGEVLEEIYYYYQLNFVSRDDN